MDFLQHLPVSWFTGLLPIISKMGITAVLIAGFIAFELLAPAWFLPGLRKISLWVAVVLGYGFIAYTVGVTDENNRWGAWYKAAVAREALQGEAIRKNSERAIAAQPPASVRLDKRNRDNWKK